MITVFHLSLDVDWALKQAESNPAFAAGIFKNITPDDAIKVLKENLAIGRKVLPFNNCNAFDYKKGCQGHREGCDD